MDFIAAILLLALLVWSPLILTRLPLVAGCLIFLLLTNCFSVEFARFDIGPLNMSLDRFFLIFLVGAFLVQRRTVPPGLTRRLAWDDLLLGAFAVFVTASTFLHDWRTSPTSDIQIVQHLINGYLTPLVLFWIARQSAVTERQLRWTYLAFVVFGVYLALTGLMEVYRQWDFVFPRYIADPKLSLHFGRARGPMVHAVTFGTTLATCVICGWALWPTLTARGRIVLAGLAPLAAAGLFYSFTRSVWLGTAADDRRAARALASRLAADRRAVEPGNRGLAGRRDPIGPDRGLRSNRQHGRADARVRWPAWQLRLRLVADVFGPAAAGRWLWAVSDGQVALSG